jgi:hypothetical protein
MAAYINQQQNSVQGVTASAGDLALLVAMHVATKEISNWTWQTFYWAPDPSNPYSPSSTLAYSNKPAQLSAAASHYAVSVAYLMVTPNQPLIGGTNKNVNAMIGYNPYLEAGFDSTTFGFKNKLNPNFKFGVQTNCMSCHALAIVENAAQYSADQYIGLHDLYYLGRVKLDFAWSIQQALITSASKKAKK